MRCVRPTADSPPPRRSPGRRLLAGTLGGTLAASLLTALLTTVLTAASVTVGVSTAHAAEVYPRGASGTVTISGRGFGHGHGMSQWGAYGAASQGIGWQQIVDHYYPGTVRTPIGNPTVRVDVSGDLGQMAFSPAAGQWANFGTSGTAVAPMPIVGVTGSPIVVFVVQRLDPANARVLYQTRDGAWTQWGPAATQVGITNRSTGTVTAWGTTSGRFGSIRGEFRGVMVSGALAPVAVVPMDEYLRGVVPHESPASWPANALAAQAVAARSYAAYALAHPRSSAFDICDSTSCQVYQARSFVASTDAAITATAGVALRYQGQPVFAEFGASTGGWNSAGSQPYLPAQPDPWDNTPANPSSSWTVTVSAATMQANWPSIGTYQGIQILARDGAGMWGGRVVTALVYGSAGSVSVSGGSLEAQLGLRSTYLTIVPDRPDLYAPVLSGTASGRVELRGATGASAYAAPSPTAVTGIAGANPAQWRFVAGHSLGGARSDLVGVHTSGTASGRTEITVSSSASGYTSSRVFVTPLPAFTPDSAWQVSAGKSPGDVCFILLVGGASHSVEVHCLAASSGYTTWALHAATVIVTGVPSATSRFLVAPGTGDLYWVMHGGVTGSGRPELHGLSAASGFRSWVMHAALPLAFGSDTTAMYALSPTGGAPDLTWVILSGGGSGRVEVHTLSAATAYGQFSLHAATGLAMSTYPVMQPSFG